MRPMEGHQLRVGTDGFTVEETEDLFCNVATNTTSENRCKNQTEQKLIPPVTDTCSEPTTADLHDPAPSSQDVTQIKSPCAPPHPTPDPWGPNRPSAVLSVREVSHYNQGPLQGDIWIYYPEPLRG